MQPQPDKGQNHPPKRIPARAGKALLELLAPIVWLYIIIKLFVFDFDIYIVDTYAPHAKWLLSYKLFIFLGALAILALLGRGTTGIKIAAFVFFYPFIVLLWRIPKTILRTNSWTIAFAAINVIATSVRSFRYKIIASTLFLISAVILITANDQLLTITASVSLVAILGVTYIRAIISAFRPNALFRVYKTALPSIRNQIISNNKLDQDLKHLPVAQLDAEQSKKWGNKLENPVLANRAYLFFAKRGREYQQSAAPFVAAIASIFALFFLTMFTFACVSYGAHSLDPKLYETVGNLSFATFAWYSFNALLFNFVREITPVAPLSQFLWMTEAFSALFLVTILISLYFSIRNQRKSGEMDEVIKAMEIESREIENFIKAEYQIDSIETALAELNRLETSVAKLLLWLTDNMR